eukprot:271857_1
MSSKLGKRTLSESIEGDSSSFSSTEPPRKRRKKYLQSALKSQKRLSNENKSITIYYQTTDYTKEQINYILSNTIKGVNRPIFLFSDNDIDNYWLRINRNNTNTNTNTNTQSNRHQLYDKDYNSLLIGP